MIGELAFLGNFHPIIVHFPLALVPVAIALKLWGWRRSQPRLGDAGATLLKLSLVFALLAATLGMVNARVNGFSANQIGTHAGYAWSTIAVLAFALLLPEQQNSASLSVARFFSQVLRGCLLVVGKIWWVLKWLLMILLFPFVSLFILLRKVYRLTLAKRLNPLVLAAWIKVKGWVSSGFHRLIALSTFRNWRNFAYTASLLLVFLTGYEGGNLVHGQGHLAKNAPEWAAGALGAKANEIAPSDFNHEFFEEAVAPILRKNCMKCHGEDKAKGGLRLHTLDNIVAAGVISPGEPLGSELLRRVLLSRDDPSAMPPKKNGRGLNAQEISQLLAWVNGEVSGEDGGGENGPVAPDYYVTLANAMRALSDDTVQSLNRYQASVVRLQESLPMLGVNLQFVAAEDLPHVIKSLLPVAQNIVDFDASGQSISPELISLINDMNNLLRLNLSRTNSGDKVVESIASLQQLRWLNLFETSITETSRQYLEALPKLQKVYAGGTAMEPVLVIDANDRQLLDNNLKI